jgi:hypothetical protein
MATLSVLKFDDPYGADRVLIALQGLHERRMITVVDAAVVSWPQGNKRPKTRQLKLIQETPKEESSRANSRQEPTCRRASGGTVPTAPARR